MALLEQGLICQPSLWWAPSGPGEAHAPFASTKSEICPWLEQPLQLSSHQSRKQASCFFMCESDPGPPSCWDWCQAHLVDSKSPSTRFRVKEGHLHPFFLRGDTGAYNIPKTIPPSSPLHMGKGAFTLVLGYSHWMCSSWPGASLGVLCYLRASIKMCILLSCFSILDALLTKFHLLWEIQMSHQQRQSCHLQPLIARDSSPSKVDGGWLFSSSKLCIYQFLRALVPWLQRYALLFRVGKNRRNDGRCLMNRYIVLHYPGRHGNPLQYSCLENPMDRGTWQATVHGVTNSQTRLKQLSTHETFLKSKWHKVKKQLP